MAGRDNESLINTPAISWSEKREHRVWGVWGANAGHSAVLPLVIFQQERLEVNANTLSGSADRHFATRGIIALFKSVRGRRVLHDKADK